jgi:2-polyprenyl-3-methyl-5-hydroxy-6-metoxy-1,4-benzoquinol methylase
MRQMGQYDFSVGSYADVGCGDGYVTSQVMRATRAKGCNALDSDAALLQVGARVLPDIHFVQFNLNNEAPDGARYDFVTCFETLEHVINLPVAVKNLLRLTKPGGTLLLTVPIEVGSIGIAKFTAKTLLWGDRLTEAFAPRPKLHRQYLRALILGRGIHDFRKPGNALGYWPGHWGFDYRTLDTILAEHGAEFRSFRFLTTRFYDVRPK